MGNALDKSTGGQQQQQQTSSGNVEDSNRDTTPHRRYYPRSTHKHPHFVAASTSTELFSSSCPLFEQASPLRKRLRTSAATQVEETLSLRTSAGLSSLLAPSTPPNQSPYSRYNKHRLRTFDSPSANAYAMSETPWSTSLTSTPQVDPIRRQAQSIANNRLIDNHKIDNHKIDNRQIANEEELDDTSLLNGVVQKDSNVHMVGQTGFDAVGGPITKAVISQGLKARFKSISAWLLNEPAKVSSMLCK